MNFLKLVFDIFGTLSKMIKRHKVRFTRINAPPAI